MGYTTYDKFLFQFRLYIHRSKLCYYQEDTHIYLSKYLLVKYLSIERELQCVQTPQKMLLPLG